MLLRGRLAHRRRAVHAADPEHHQLLLGRARAQPYYGCIFGNPTTDMKNTIEGDSPMGVIFPAYPEVLTGGRVPPTARR